MAVTKAKRSVRKKQSARRGGRSTKETRGSGRPTLPPGSLGLLERKLPSRRFVDFPQVKDKIIERVHVYTATDYHSITLNFKDQTCLNLEIEPSFTINAEFQQLRKGDIDIIAEWPPIHSQK